MVASRTPTPTGAGVRRPVEGDTPSQEIIELREQAPSAIALSHEEVGALRTVLPNAELVLIDGGESSTRDPAAPGGGSLGGNHVSQPHLDRRRYVLNPRQAVGHFRVGDDETSRTARIEPKVGIANVFALLAASYEFYEDDPPFLPVPVAYGAEPAPMLEPLVSRFCEVVAELLRDGLARAYVELEENRAALRGRIVWQRQLRDNIVAPHRLYCRFAHSEVDTPENQLVLWALLLLQRLGGWSRPVRQTLQSHVLHFGGVTLRPFRPRQSPRFVYDRLTARYRAVHAWCRLFVDLLGLSDRPGETVFSGYVLDINELFERFVAATLQRAARRVPGVSVRYHEPGHTLDTERRVRIVPDIILRGGLGRTCVVDAKYKRNDGSTGAKHPDLYQLIAYCGALGLIRRGGAPTTISATERTLAMLIYPSSERSQELEEELDVVTSPNGGSGLSVRIMWLDLDRRDIAAHAERRCAAFLRELTTTRSQLPALKAP
ncbi:MAG: McrC family protein [Chloroflexota bacterium]